MTAAVPRSRGAGTFNQTPAGHLLHPGDGILLDTEPYRGQLLTVSRAPTRGELWFWDGHYTHEARITLAEFAKHGRMTRFTKLPWNSPILRYVRLCGPDREEYPLDVGEGLTQPG